MTMLDKLSYTGKRVVVTGAASGIGRSTAETLLDLGAEVYALDINATDSGSHYVPLNLMDPKSIDTAIDTVGGRINALFNCAGLGGGARPIDIVVCNFVGTRHLIENAVEYMDEGAAIVTVSSTGGAHWRSHVDAVASLIATPTFADGQAWAIAHAPQLDNAYGFSKEAVTLYTVLKAPQLAPAGIRINSVSPHATITPMWQEFVDHASDEHRALATSLQGRTAGPESQAYAMAFLNSDAAYHVNGTDLLVDGGFVAGMTPDIGSASLPAQSEEPQHMS